MHRNVKGHRDHAKRDEEKNPLDFASGNARRPEGNEEPILTNPSSVPNNGGNLNHGYPYTAHYTDYLLLNSTGVLLKTKN